MEKFIKGEVVILPVPYTDFSQTTKRPALIVANLMGDDLILCQITTKNRPDPYAISLDNPDFESGKIFHPSYIRANRLFTAENSLILYKTGTIKEKKLQEVIRKIMEILQ